MNVSSNDSVNDISTFIDFDNSLVGWWRMDDISDDGLIVYDNSSYGNDGNVFGDVVQTDDGKLGKGFEFDGVGDYVDIGDQSEFDAMPGITISAWIKRAGDTGANAVIVSKFWDGTDRSFYFYSDMGFGSM